MSRQRQSDLDPFELCVSWLKSSDRTEHELKQRLKKRGVDEATADQALGRLKELGWLSDDRVVQREVELARTRKGQGKLRTRAQLLKRGIDEDQAEKALSESSEEDELARAEAVLNKKLKPDDGPPKAARLLASRGFEEEVIRSALESRFGDWEAPLG